MEKYVIWLLLWSAVILVPNIFYKIKLKSFYFENKPILYSIWFTGFSVVVFFIYKNSLLNYFGNSLHILLTGSLLIAFVWFFRNLFIRQKKSTRLHASFQIPKFFEILYQQILFLAGLLTFNMSPILYGGIFFLIHIPVLFLLPKRFATILVLASGLGGICFAYLQSFGVYGFLGAMFCHFMFYIGFDYFSNRNEL